MAFDAGMMAAVAAELQQTIIGSKIEKIYQPGKDRDHPVSAWCHAATDGQRLR